MVSGCKKGLHVVLVSMRWPATAAVQTGAMTFLRLLYAEACRGDRLRAKRVLVMHI